MSFTECADPDQLDSSGKSCVWAGAGERTRWRGREENRCRALSSRLVVTMVEDQEILRMHRIRKTCTQMLTDRGYIVNTDDSEISLDEFKNK